MKKWLLKICNGPCKYEYYTVYSEKNPNDIEELDPIIDELGDDLFNSYGYTTQLSDYLPEETIAEMNEEEQCDALFNYFMENISVSIQEDHDEEDKHEIIWDER